MPLVTKVWIRLSVLHWAFMTASFSKPLLWERMLAWFATSAANIFWPLLEAYLQRAGIPLRKAAHFSPSVLYVSSSLCKAHLTFLESVLGGGPASRQLEHGLEACMIPVPFSWIPLDPFFPNYSVFTLTPKHIMGPPLTPQYTTTNSK